MGTSFHKIPFKRYIEPFISMVRRSNQFMVFFFYFNEGRFTLVIKSFVQKNRSFKKMNVVV